MRSLGVDNDSKVVLYDHKYDSTRVWWAFFKNGKKDIRILDGGIAGWKALVVKQIFLPLASQNLETSRRNLMLI